MYRGPMITLRDYQQDLVDKARISLAEGHRSTLVVAPTGAGKTIIFSYICQKAYEKGKRILILAHRKELIEQISESLEKFSIPHGFIAAGKFSTNPAAKVFVGSVLSVVNRLGRIAKPDLIILDEAHHAAKKNSWAKCLDHWNDVLKLGVTATPCRLSGEPLKEIFDNMVMGPTTKNLIERKYLCDYRYFCPPVDINFANLKKQAGDYSTKSMDEEINTVAIIGNVIKHYKKYLHESRAVVFCVSIAHAAALARQFKAEGISSGHIWAGMKKDERTEIIRKFRQKEILVLTNVGIVSEGFDLPELDGVILLRPTQSLSLFMQQVGRALRISEGKDKAIILDHVGNYKRHGMPDDERDWSLEGSVSDKKGTSGDAAPKMCPECFYMNEPASLVCVECEHEFLTKDKKVEEIDGELEEVDRSVRKQIEKEGREQRKQEERQARGFEALVELGKKRGYKYPAQWARYRQAARERYNKS